MTSREAFLEAVRRLDPHVVSIMEADSDIAEMMPRSWRYWQAGADWAQQLAREPFPTIDPSMLPKEE